MSLTYGTKSITTVDGEKQVSIDRQGMTQAIYDEMDAILSLPLQKMITDAETDDEKDQAENALAEARKNWEKLAFAVAKGVVDHIKNHMEIHDVEVSIRTSEEVSGTTDSATATGSGHTHDIDIDDILDDVIFDQRPNTGRVE